MSRLSIALLGGMTLLLTLSVGLNFALFDRAKQYYTEVNATRLDPIGLGAYEKIDRRVEPTKEENIRVVFMGDSRAASWPAPTAEGYEFINRGIGSQTSVQVLQRFSDHVVPLRPDVVILQVGINALKTIALFPENATEIVANAKFNIEQLITESEKIGAVVVVSSILPAGKITLARRAFWSDDIYAAADALNQHLLTLAEVNKTDKIVWFDAFAVVADTQGRMDAEYRKDELHLNAAGYEALNQSLATQLPSISQLVHSGDDFK